MDNDSAAEDAVWADELDVVVRDGALSIALSVGLEVAKITYMALAVLWSTVGLAVWVDLKDTC